MGQSLMPGLVIEGLIDEDGAGSKLYSVTGGGLFVFNQKSGSGYRLYTHVCEEARRSQMCCARREHVCLLVYGRFCVLPFPFACLCTGEFLLPSPFLSPITLTRAQSSHSQLLMPDPESGLDSDGASATSALPLPDMAFSSPMSRGTCFCDASCGAPECADYFVHVVCLQRRMLLARRRTQRNRWQPRIKFRLSGHSRARAHTHTHKHKQKNKNDNDQSVHICTLLL